MLIRLQKAYVETGSQIVYAPTFGQTEECLGYPRCSSMIWYGHDIFVHTLFLLTGNGGDRAFGTVSPVVLLMERCYFPLI